MQTTTPTPDRLAKRFDALFRSIGVTDVSRLDEIDWALLGLPLRCAVNGLAIVGEHTTDVSDATGVHCPEVTSRLLVAAPDDLDIEFALNAVIEAQMLRHAVLWPTFPDDEERTEQVMAHLFDGIDVDPDDELEQLAPVGPFEAECQRVMKALYAGLLGQ